MGGVGRRKMKEEKQCDFAKAVTEVGSLFLAQRGVPRPAGRLAGGRLSVILLTSEDLVSPTAVLRLPRRLEPAAATSTPMAL